MTETVELKPCPFCGGTNLKSGGDDKIVGTWCLTCEASGPNQYGDFEWNTRSDPAVRDRVKPLEWEDRGEGEWTAETIFGSYYLPLQRGGVYNVLVNSGDYQSCLAERVSEATAKATAQAHNEQRILSALEPRTPPPEPASGWKWALVPDYPSGDVVGACICGSWPGGKCLKCPPAKEPQ